MLVAMACLLDVKPHELIRMMDNDKKMRDFAEKAIQELDAISGERYLEEFTSLCASQ